MTKAEFVDRVAIGSDSLRRTQTTRNQGGRRGPRRGPRETLRRGGEVSFTGFGKFTVADRGARQGVNPQTGERIQMPTTTRVPCPAVQRRERA